jgi:archaellum component FlaC
MNTRLTINLVISFFLFFTVNFVTGQSLSKDELTKAVNYLNCKSILLALNLSPTEGVTTEFQAKCKCNDFPTSQTIKDAIRPTETKTVELFEEINSIIEKEKIKDTTALIKLLTEDIFNNKEKYAKINAFASSKKAYIEDIKRDLISKIREPNFFSNINTSNDSVVQTQVVASNNEKTITNQGGWFEGISSQMIVISILFSLLFVIIFFLIIRKQFANISKTIEPLMDKKLHFIEIEIRNITNDLNQLKNKFEKFIETKKTIEPNPEISNISSPKDPIRTVFYLSMPESERIFSDQTKHSKLESGRSIFEAIEINSNLAEFSICKDKDSIIRIFNNLDKFIKPVCDESNSPGNASRIITEKPGKIELDLEKKKWIVKEKAIIRYES